MRRLVLLSLLAAALLACQAVGLVFNSPTPNPSASATDLPSPTAAPATAAPATAVPATGSPTATQVARQASPPFLLARGGYSVRVHPDGGLYVGDQVSFEILAPENQSPEAIKAELALPGEAMLGPYEFGPYGIASRPQATLFWVWDTTGLAPQEYELSFSIQPGGPAWTETISLLPRETLPAEQAGARWISSESECCLVYTISGSQAEQDLPELLGLVDAEFEAARQYLPAELEAPIPIIFLPRVMGHGGFASQELAISYLERNYAGGQTEMVVHHEVVHYLDGLLGGELRPSLLVEGLAVYLSGGHYKPEPLIPRAAALLEQGGYLPLASLLDDFYLAQHESSYLQAGSLVEYMVDRWGWEAFERFYRDIHPDPQGGSQLAALDAALLAHFNLTLESLEKEFQEVLRLQQVTPGLREDVRLTIAYYESVRRYQLALDPSAYYLTAWLPDSAQMRERGIVADYLRHPTSPENLLIEDLFVAADGRLQAGDYPAAEAILGRINAILDSLPTQEGSNLGR